MYVKLPSSLLEEVSAATHFLWFNAVKISLWQKFLSAIAATSMPIVRF
jgi:hypothetical protein